MYLFFLQTGVDFKTVSNISQKYKSIEYVQIKVNTQIEMNILICR